jgi:hypothetical protein
MSLANMGFGQESVTAALTARHGTKFGMSGGERARLASGVYKVARRPLFCDPFQLALALGLALCPVSPYSPAPADRTAHCVYYEWLPCERETKLRVYHGIARELLVSMRRDHCEIEECLFAAEIALPEMIARTTMTREAATLQPHVPIWWLRARMMGFHKSGVMAKPVL